MVTDCERIQVHLRNLSNEIQRPSINVDLWEAAIKAIPFPCEAIGELCLLPSDIQ